MSMHFMTEAKTELVSTIFFSLFCNDLPGNDKFRQILRDFLVPRCCFKNRQEILEVSVPLPKMILFLFVAVLAGILRSPFFYTSGPR